MTSRIARLPHLASQTPPDRSTLERVLDAAAALFWEKGYAAATTREIAAMAGIQQASLYGHFSSKADLLHHVCVSSMERLQAAATTAVHAASDPSERIHAFIHAHIQALLRHQNRHVTTLTQLRALSGPHRSEVLALRKKYADFVRSLLEEGQTAGALRTDISSKYLCLALLNILNRAVLWFRPNQALSAGQIGDLFARIYLEGALAPSVPPPPAPKVSRTKQSASNSRQKARTSRNPTSERMLDSAAALFAHRGYTATSTREIATGLGIRKASLYYHIETKEDLLYAICQSSLDQIRRDVETALQKDQPPLDRVRKLICAHIESLLRDQDKHTVALAEMQLLSAERRAHIISLRDAYESMARRVLQEAQNAGVLRGDIPAKHLCLSLLGLINRVAVWYSPRGSLSPRQLGEVFSILFLTGAAVRADSPHRPPLLLGGTN